MKRKTYIRRGSLGFKSLNIMIDNELKALWSNKQIIYGSLISPVLYFLFYSVGIQSTFGDIEFMGETVNFLSYSLIGIFAMSLFKEMYQCVYRMITDKRWGLLSLKIYSGINPPVYIIGISTFPTIGVVVQTVLLYILSILIGGSFSVLKFFIILAFLIMCILFWASVLICISILIKNYKQRDFVMDTLMLPILFSAPLFYSFENAPRIIQILSFINPLSYQVQAMREIAFGVANYINIILVLGLSILAYVFAVVLLSRTDFKSDEH